MARTMKLTASICTPGVRMLTVYVGLEESGEWYHEVCPVVAIQCEAYTNEGDEPQTWLRPVCMRESIGTEHENKHDGEASQTLCATWPPDEDAKALAGVIESLRRYVPARRAAPMQPA